MKTVPWIPILDLKRCHEFLADAFHSAFNRVLESNRYLSGPETELLEHEWSNTYGYTHSVACSSGSSALYIALKALGIGPGDEVITTPFTFIATVEAILMAGARPVFVDIDRDTGLMNLDLIESAVTSRTACVLVVHLYGQMPDMEHLTYLCERKGIYLIEDAAQAHGACWRGRPAGSWGDAGCFSFYPTKNLGGLGDGGIVVTRDFDAAEHCRRIRNHGRSGHYYHVEFGFNFRMNEIQAALLRVKLPYLTQWIEQRNAIVREYRMGTEGNPLLKWIKVDAKCQPAWHLATLRVSDRNNLQKFLKSRQIDSAVHYPISLDEQPALQGVITIPQPLENAHSMAREVLSIPLFPELTQDEIQRVVSALNDYCTD